MYKKAWCMCKVVVLLIKPIVYLTFSLPSASLDLKVPSTVALYARGNSPSPITEVKYGTVPSEYINLTNFWSKSLIYKTKSRCTKIERCGTQRLAGKSIDLFTGTAAILN